MPEQSLLTGAVFLSYASEDADAAARICEALRAAGVEVWFDRSELRGGDAWDSQIKKQIHDCALFVPLISAHTNARIEGYFRGEWNLATRRLVNRAHNAAFLVPVVIDETREADASVPEEFLRAQWTRLPGGETPPAFATRVRQLLGADIAPVHHSHTAVTEAIKPSARSKTSARQWYWFAGGRGRHRAGSIGFALIALLLILGGGAIWYYQDAHEVPAAIPAPATAPSIAVSTPSQKSIAVLPFVNMSSEKEQEYFSDGLSEELLNLLSKVPDLRVAARTSSFYYKGKDVKLAEVARELQVAHLLEGSVRKSGNRVRITTQLIRASDGYHQWSETYDRTLEDIFAVQEEIAAAVVSQLKVTLLGTPRKTRTTTPEAYALYLEALQLGNRGGTSRFDDIIALYKRVLEIDPNYAPAWLGLGANYAGKADFGQLPLAEGMERSREMAHKALAIDPQYGLAHARLGWLALKYDHDLAAAAQHFERALALDPSHMDILALASDLSLALGRLDLGVPLGEYFITRDPLSSGAHSYLGTAYLMAGRFKNAIASFRAALKLNPTWVFLHEGIGDALLLSGDYEAALSEYKKLPQGPQRLVGLACAYYDLRQATESDAALSKLIEKYKNWAVHIALVYAYRGENDRAFAWLEKAVIIRDSTLYNLPTLIWLKNLHDDPRWLPFLRKIGKAPEQLAAIEFELKVPAH